MKPTLKELMASKPSSVAQVYLPEAALQRWNPALVADDDSDDQPIISILDVIGDFGYGEGVSVKRIETALRAIGRHTDVTVLINSPGGDMFEGIAIHSLLNDHRGQVTVKILGLAASAASVIAMAGDTIKIAPAAFYMIHNCWMLGIGDRNDFSALAEWMEPFDVACADLYAERTGNEEATLLEWMDAETWMGGKKAIEAGFAEELLNREPKEDDSKQAKAMNALREMDIAMAKGGMPRNRRRELLQQIKTGTHDAAGNGTPSAAEGDTLVAVSRIDVGSAARLTADLAKIELR